NGDRALLLCYRAGSPLYCGFEAAIRVKARDDLDPQWMTLVHRLDSERPIRPAMKRHYGFRPSLAHQTDALGEREHGRTRDDATLGEGLHQTVLKHPALGKAKSEEAADQPLKQTPAEQPLAALSKVRLVEVLKDGTDRFERGILPRQGPVDQPLEDASERLPQSICGIQHLRGHFFRD